MNPKILKALALAYAAARLLKAMAGDPEAPMAAWYYPDPSSRYIVEVIIELPDYDFAMIKVDRDDLDTHITGTDIVW